MRSHYCGQVNEKLVGQEVTVAGWVHRRRDHGGVIFVDLRDRVHRFGYTASAAADRILSRLLPGRWVPLYAMVSHTTTPYADALARARRQDRILRGAGAGLALAATLAVTATVRAGRRRSPGR